MDPVTIRASNTPHLHYALARWLNVDFEALASRGQNGQLLLDEDGVRGRGGPLPTTRAATNLSKITSSIERLGSPIHSPILTPLRMRSNCGVRFWMG